MTAIITKLSSNLLSDIKKADEIWIAVALMSYDGLSFILDNIKPTCRQNYLIGIDLPTDPKALKKLNALQYKSDCKVLIYYSVKEYFHPKLYLTRSSKNYSAFVGSANCTSGGLANNVELTTYTQDTVACNQLIQWFEDYCKEGKPLTEDFIRRYELTYSERKKRKKEEDKLVKKEKQALNKEYEIILSHKTEFLNALKKYRKDIGYDDIVLARDKAVKELRKDLDYPHYKNLNIDSYFSHWDLGHLIAIAVPSIKRQIPKLKRLLKYLSDESIDIAVRYERALMGDLKVDGVSKAFISKVLAVHKPDLYFVKNGKTENALRKYGIQLPRGLSEGEKYKITCKYLRQICKDTDIKDLTVLDYYLYIEGQD